MPIWSVDSGVLPACDGVTRRPAYAGFLLRLARPAAAGVHDSQTIREEHLRPNLLRAQREAAARATRCPGIPRSSFAPHFPTAANDSEASRKPSASEFISDLGASSGAFAPDGAAPEGLDLKTSEGYDWRVRTTAATACTTVTVAEPDTPPAVAVTTAVPFLRAVTKPAESTAATPG